MILTLRLGERLVSAGCPDVALVNNGKEWVAPVVGEYATLIYGKPTVIGVLNYPVNEVQVPSNYRIDTLYLCLIEGVSSGTQAPGVMSSIDPLNGTCPCLICNTGTNLLNIQVTNV